MLIFGRPIGKGTPDPNAYSLQVPRTSVAISRDASQYSRL
jgi:hypothetical protein